MMLGMILIIPLLGGILLSGLVGGVVGGAASYIICSTIWKDDEVKDQVKKTCPTANKLKIEKKSFYSGSYKIEAGIFNNENRLGDQSIDVESCPDSVYVGKVYYLD